MCRLLHVHSSGFYARLKNPLSRRANEDNRKIDLLLKAWEESCKLSGYRKLHDNLLDQDETCYPNRRQVQGCGDVMIGGTNKDPRKRHPERGRVPIRGKARTLKGEQAALAFCPERTEFQPSNNCQLCE